MPSGRLVGIEGAALAWGRRRRLRRGGLVRREAGLLGLAAGPLLGLPALLLLGFAARLLLGLPALLLLPLEPGTLLLLAEPRRPLADLAGDRLDDHLAGADGIVVAGDHVAHRVRVAVGVDQ